MKVRKNIAISDSGFIFNPANGESFSANPIGMEIIKHLKNGKSQQQIVEFLSEDYDIDINTLNKDIYDFTQLLQQYQLAEF